MMIRIGLSSDDYTLQPLLTSALGKDFTVLLATDIHAMHRMIESGACDVVLLDLDSKHKLQLQRLEACRTIVACDSAVVVMADDALRTSAVELVRLGAHGYCRRPPAIRELKTLLVRAHENFSMRRTLQTVQQQQLETTACCDRLIGSSPQMRQVYDLVHRVANVNASVLITGESGTGKELIANAIHNLGARSTHPFVAVCCGAIPETLIEAELFGHEKGAFTGSTGSRVGYLEQAGEGTLFLDELGELSLATQVKLLRVLQQREFCRLGSNRLIPLRARLVFATHQNLAQMVVEGSFRQDLFYRINVIRIEAPPLQEHPEDIAQIADHFLKHYSEMYQKPMREIASGAMATLQAYAWPGNVRELENVIQRAIILAAGDRLELENLPCTLQAQNVVNIDEYAPSGSFERQLRDYKFKLATTAVREHNGNKTLAARHLNISRAYLHRLIRNSEPDLFDSEHLEEQKHSSLGVA